MWNCRRKVKALAVPRGWVLGLWLQMTSVWVKTYARWSLMQSPAARWVYVFVQSHLSSEWTKPGFFCCTQLWSFFLTIFGHKMLKSSFFINIRNMLDNKSTYLSAFRSFRTWLCMVLNTDKEAFWLLPHKFRVIFFIITLSTSCDICFECSK